MRLRYNKNMGVWCYIFLVLFIGWQSLYIDTASAGLPIVGAFYWPIIGFISVPYVGILLLPLSILYCIMLVYAFRYLHEILRSRDVTKILVVIIPLVFVLVIRHANRIPGGLSYY